MTRPEHAGRERGEREVADPGARLDLDVRVPERDVRLALSPRPGRTTAVIGPNGAGKSTLLGAIGGMVSAEGSVRVDGRELLTAPVHRRRVG